ncbi:hypothetical protein KHP62_09425 [Rhodobacteraceae bacterium NNCM2]|nr:hypothetical protein [Coraliihabitans acroporae]
MPRVAKAAPATAPAVASTPVATSRPTGVKPLPTGPNVAKPVNYSQAEILAYCRQGWDSRNLTDGTVEYNPCYYQ